MDYLENPKPEGWSYKGYTAVEIEELRDNLINKGAQIPYGLVESDRIEEILRRTRGLISASVMGSPWEAFEPEELVDLQEKLAGTMRVSSGLAWGDQSIWDPKLPQ